MSGCLSWLAVFAAVSVRLARSGRYALDCSNGRHHFWRHFHELSSLFFLAPQFCASDNARVPFTEPDRSWHELQADATLAEIDLHEELAEIYDESVGHGRQQFARKYRELIGVHPDQRADFRIVLENVREGGQRPVQDIIADFQDQSQNSSVVGD